MEMIVAAWNALLAEPMALVMALVAVVCTIGAVSRGNRVRDRVLLVVLALTSGMSAWMMASRWRW